MKNDTANSIELMESVNIKEEAKRLVDKLPENTTWDNLMYQIYVRQTVEAGLADSNAGRTFSNEEGRARFNLPR